jgi:sulfite reductase alpha subunit-like flavoprotein
VKFTTDEEEKAQLKLYASDEAKYLELLKEKTNILDFMNRYNSIRIPMEVLLQVLPRIQPRYYTISSSFAKDPSKVSFTISLTEDEERGFTGFLSSFVQQQQVNMFRKEDALMNVYFESSSFALPKGYEPIIMIGPGSGIAPFIAFLDEI